MWMKARKVPGLLAVKPAVDVALALVPKKGIEAWIAASLLESLAMMLIFAASP